jgi:hypothetical protein
MSLQTSVEKLIDREAKNLTVDNVRQVLRAIDRNLARVYNRNVLRWKDYVAQRERDRPHTDALRAHLGLDKYDGDGINREHK